MGGFNITKEKHNLIKNLSTNKEILIQKSENGNSVVVFTLQILRFLPS